MTTLTAEKSQGIHRGFVMGEAPAVSASGWEYQAGRLRILRDPAELDALRAAWNQAPKSPGTPMQDFAWARTCAEVFGCEDTMHFVALGPGVPHGLAPLARCGFPPRLQLIGAPLFEPGDFSFRDETVLDLLARSLARLRMPLFLNRVFADAPVIDALRRAYSPFGAVLCRDAGACPSLPLDDTWAEPERHLNAGRRSDFRRLRKMAEKLGPVTCDVLSPTPGELPSLLEEAYAVEAACWKGREGSALSCDRLRGEFFRRYSAETCRLGTLRLCFLRIGGEAAAMHLAIECGERFWLLKIGYSDRFARCSPGMLLIAETIRYAAGRKLRSYEFLGSAQPWTRVFAGCQRPCVAVRAYPPTLRGAASFGVDAAGAGWQRLKAAFRAKERR